MAFWELRMLIISVLIVRAFSRIRARVAPRVLYFSAFIFQELGNKHMCRALV